MSDGLKGKADGLGFPYSCRRNCHWNVPAAFLRCIRNLTRKDMPDSSAMANTPPTRRAGWRWALAQGLEKRWWKRYLRKLNASEYRTWKSQYWLKLLEPHREALELDRPQRLLDAGCGPAGINVVLKGHQVLALDPLLDFYAAELPMFSSLKGEGVEYRTQSLEQHQPAVLYDGACCMNAINHVDDLDAALDALTAAVKPGGWLLMGVDAHRHGVLKRLFRLLPGDALHPHQHDAAEYRAMLQSRGWVISDERVQKPGGIFDYVLFRAALNK